MRDQIRSEIRKMRSTRSAWGLLAAAVALAGLAAWAMVASMDFGPAVALSVFVLSANMAGDSLNESLDPKLKGRRVRRIVPRLAGRIA